jgi:hypothetical protein
MRRTTWATVCATALAGAIAVPAVALSPASPTPPTPVAGGQALSAANPVLDFAGQMHNPAPLPTVSNPDPTVCTVDCQLWSLTVATSRPFLVSLHNTSSSVDDGFNLYVYDPSGQQVASSAGIGADGEAAAVTPTTQGVYTVAVTVTYAYDTDAGYLGEARIMSAPTWDQVRCASPPPCAVLPALSVQPPADVHVDGIPPVASTPLGFPFPVDASTGNSCYLDETASSGASRCLRFTSEVDDVGSGLLTLQIPWAAASSGQPTAGVVPGQCEAQQVITLTDGTSERHDAGPCEWHAEHGHFHYADFVEFSLHSVNPDGTTGATVAQSLKESFCLADDGYIGFGTPGPNGPRSYVGQPGCNLPSPPTPDSPDAWITMGLSPGWGDIYTWDTPDQFIDVTSTPPGVYDIVSRANPAGLLALSGDSRPCAATRVQLTATGVSVVDPDVPCT